MNEMHTNTHHVSLSSVLKPSAKADMAHPFFNSKLVWMPAEMREFSSRVLKSLKTYPELSLTMLSLREPFLNARGLLAGVYFSFLFPYGTCFSARHQSRPDAILVRSIPGRPSHIDPSKIPPQDRDIHLVEFRFYTDTNPFPNLEAAAASAQHADTIIRLKNSSSRNPNRNNKVTLHTILVGVADPIYNDYTIKPLINL
eukprot:1145007-Pelagomonas_calceolata.AAC.1